MRRILRYLWRDKVDLLFLVLVTAGIIYFALSIEILFAAILFIVKMFTFRMIMWMGQTIDTNEKLTNKIKYLEYWKSWLHKEIDKLKSLKS